MLVQALAARDRDGGRTQLGGGDRALCDRRPACHDDGARQGAQRLEGGEACGDILGVGSEALVGEGVALREDEHAGGLRGSEPRAQLVGERVGVLGLGRDDKDRRVRRDGEGSDDGGLRAIADAEGEGVRGGHAAAEAVERDRPVDDGQQRRKVHAPPARSTNGG